MEKIILDGEKMTEKTAAHEHIAEVMAFPEWYGNNLDALWDMLSESGEREIELVNSAAMLNALGSYGCRLLQNRLPLELIFFPFSCFRCSSST